MRFKYYLRGIGLGILFSVVVMAVSIYFHKSELMSDSDVIKRATELGMVMGESVNTEASADTEVETASEVESSSKVESSSETETTTEKPLDGIVPGTETTTTEIIPATDTIETEETADYVVIKVEPGDNPRALCEKLKAHNIIEDADDFRHYIGRKPSRVLMVGDYQIPKDASYDDIIKIIFKK